MHDLNTDNAERPDYIRPLKARWWLIALVGIVAAFGAYRYYANKPVYYTASTSLYMKSATAADLLAGGSSGGPTDPTFLANQALLLRTPGVAAMAARKLGYSGPPSALLGQVSAAPQTGTDFMQITATAANPVDAGRIANAFAQAYIGTQEVASQRLAAQTIKSLQTQINALPNDAAHADQRSQLNGQITQLQLFENVPSAPAQQENPATLGVPVASNPKSHALYGLALGLIIGSALAYLLDALSRRVKRLEDVEPLYGAPVVAKIPSAPTRVRLADPRDGLISPLDEPFRALRTALQLRSRGEGSPRHLRTIMVASAAPGDGKSTVARNLALAYLEAGARVVVVDCDLRRPEISRRFKVDARPGLPEVLTGTSMPDEALRVIEVTGTEIAAVARGFDPVPAGIDQFDSDRAQSELAAAVTRTEPRAEHPPVLAVLPSHSPSWNPAAIFAAGRFEAVLSGLRSQFDIVILDTSPLAAVSDAAALLPMVDAVLLVARLKQTSTNAVQELKNVLAAVPQANVVGVVANDVHARNTPYAYARPYGQDA